MNYAKPEIIPIDGATVAIQGIPKNGTDTDSQTGSDPTKHVTAAAYEADE